MAEAKKTGLLAFEWRMGVVGDSPGMLDSAGAWDDQSATVTVLISV